MLIILLLIVLFGLPEFDLAQLVGKKPPEMKPANADRNMMWKGPSEKNISKLSPAEQRMVRAARATMN